MAKLIIKKRVPRGRCPFCQGDKEPDYKESESLKDFISERGRIIGLERTGVCAKHQRLLAREIKRARYLGLLPFTTRVR